MSDLSKGVRRLFIFDRLPPHRVGLVLAGAAVVGAAALFLQWNWLPDYYGLALAGLWRTIWILVVTCVLGFLIALPLGLAQAAGPFWLAMPARAFCTTIRGTPARADLPPGQARAVPPA